jgi:P pilus assembly chaperone PapD
MKNITVQSTVQNLFLAACILSSSLLMHSKVAFAQMMINPMVIEAETKKGQAKGTFSITNTSSTVMRARVVSEPFNYGKAGFESIKTSPTDLTPYLNLSPREFTLQPGQTRQIRLSAQLLPSLNNQELRSVIFTDNLTENDDTNNNTDAKTQTSIVPRIGVTVYVKNGKVEPKITIEQSAMSADGKSITLSVKNAGNGTARPSVNWKIMNNEQVIASGQGDSTTVIAGGDRDISLPITLEKPLPAGSYQLVGELVWSQGKVQQMQPFSTPLMVKSSSIK